MPAPVAIPGLVGLRRDLRALGRDMTREFRNAEKAAAEIIAKDAAALAPRGTRPLPANRRMRLHEAIKVMPSGSKIYVGASAKQAPHGGVVHWGGTIHPHHTTIHFKRTAFLLKAFDANRDTFVRLLEEELDSMARRHGWA